MRLTLGLALLVCAVQALPTAEDFLVTSLPGLEEKLDFKHYAGFMPLGDKAGTHLFFWFVESASDPVNDPLLYWTNGGPGSSSIAFGFWTEHGPFRLANNGTKVVPYKYSWNRRASVVYVEQPSGVGLSWSADEAHYVTNDEQSSMDNLLFLKAFFEVFPQFKKNDFFVTGESYGGHYVPQLSHRILHDPEFDAQIKMKGFFIGNPGINSDWYYNINEYAFLTFMYSHGLLPQAAYTKVHAACGWDQFLTDCGKDFTHPDAKCVQAAHEAWKYIPQTFDPYDVLAPTCHEADGAGDVMVSRNTPHLDYLRSLHGRNDSLTYDPCISRQTPIYMTNPAVLKAIHAETHPNPQWPGDRKGWKYGDETEDIAKLFPDFFANASHWRIAVVSGTADAAVPFIGTERWMDCLDRKVVDDWKYWMLNGDVAGAVKRYDGMDLITVKGCGHTIPTYCPAAGFYMLDNWLNPK
mmetsp:Transcript_33607/g.78740  ORF Transcript_33607/g.78740 Transcript_33607/m.78740 type:complete len:465 (+) Transcript_33607:2-1396(+)